MNNMEVVEDQLSKAVTSVKKGQSDRSSVVLHLMGSVFIGLHQPIKIDFLSSEMSGRARVIQSKSNLMKLIDQDLKFTLF